MPAADISEASYSQIHTQVFHFASIMSADAASVTVLPFSTEDNIKLHVYTFSQRNHSAEFIQESTLTFCRAVLPSEEIRAKTI